MQDSGRIESTLYMSLRDPLELEDTTICGKIADKVSQVVVNIYQNILIGNQSAHPQLLLQAVPPLLATPPYSN